MTALRLTWLLLRKDLRIAARSREVLGLMTLFAVLCVVIFAFGFLREGAVARSYVPGVLWVTLLFSGTVGLLRLFAAEEEGGTVALVQRTVGGTAPLFFSKLLVQWLFTTVVTLVAWPLVHLFFDTPVRGVITTAAALALGLLGQAAIGTLAAALLSRVRMREALLPLVIYPLTSPLLIAGVKVTALSLDDGDPGVIVQWLVLMVVFDAIALLASPWLHARVVQP